MKGKIDKNGCLLIERSNGVYKHQICPYNQNYCRDTCPLFGEPKNNKIEIEDYIEILGQYIILCNKTIEFEQFTDERKDPNAYEIDPQADLTQEICKRYWDLQERIDVIENISKQIDSDEYESTYSKKDDQFAADTLHVMYKTRKYLLHLEGDVIEFDNNDVE